MRVAPLAQGQGVQQPQSSGPSGAARAISMLQASMQPVPNATNISPEELSAVRTPSKPDKMPPSEETPLEAAPEETPVIPEQEVAKDPLSAQYALLARKERALRAKAQQQEAAWRAKEAAFQAREAELTAKTTPADYSNYVPKDRIKANLLSVLAETGMSADEAVQQLLNQQPADPRTEAHISRLEAQIKRLEEANENSQKQGTQSQKDSYDAAVRQISADAKKLVYTDPAFEMVKATNSVRDVVEYIEEKFKQTGEVISVEEAAQKVEDYLTEEAYKLAKLQKIQKRFQTPVAKASNVQPPQSPKQPQQMKTLTNASASSRQLSARDRALLAFKGELKA